MPQYLAGYAGRTALGIGFALVLGAVGVVLGRMGVLMFGVTSWFGWLALLVGGIGVGAGLGSATAWLWLKGMGAVFTVILVPTAVIAGICGAWYAFLYGTGVEPECCASPDMGPIAYSILGAVLVSNIVTLLLGVAGQMTVRILRRKRDIPGFPRPQAN